MDKKMASKNLLRCPPASSAFRLGTISPKSVSSRAWMTSAAVTVLCPRALATSCALAAESEGHGFCESTKVQQLTQQLRWTESVERMTGSENSYQCS